MIGCPGTQRARIWAAGGTLTTPAGIELGYVRAGGYRRQYLRAAAKIFSGAMERGWPGSQAIKSVSRSMAAAGWESKGSS